MLSQLLVVSIVAHTNCLLFSIYQQVALYSIGTLYERVFTLIILALVVN